MKNKLVLILIMLLLGSAYDSTAQFDKKWQGTLNVNGIQLDMILDIQKNQDIYSAALDIIQQGANGLRASGVTIENDVIFIEWSNLGFSIAGSIDKVGNLDALFAQGSFSAVILFTPATGTKIYNRPQEPKPKYPYQITEVSFINEREHIRLAGTLTLPHGSKNPPIAILISGSGQQDRDETVFGHKPFWVLADYLTKNGIGVLRYDDRGVGGSEQGSHFDKATSENFANDARAGIAFLRSKGYSNIGIIGHSEGGMIAPMIAAGDPDIKFIISLAGPGITGGDIVIGQSYAALDPANNQEMASFNQGLVRIAVDAIRKDLKISEMEENLNTYLNQTDMGKAMDYSARKEVIQKVVVSTTNSWMKYFIKYDPLPYLSKVKCPVLVLNGNKDTQVLAGENLAGFEKILRQSGHKNYLVKEMDGLNHLFQPAITGMLDEYETIETTFDASTMLLVKDWILKLKN